MDWTRHLGWVEKSHSRKQGEEPTHKAHNAHNAPTKQPQSTEMVSSLRDFWRLLRP